MIVDLIFDHLLLLATLLCTMNAGLLFAFSVVVMPGLGGLSDKAFIQAFQKIDGVIQKGQLLFALVWLGSALALIFATILSFPRLEPLQVGVLVTTCVVYLVGVQASTFVINIPLNKRLQAVNVRALSEKELIQARCDFEPRWNQWNRTRTIVAVVVSLLLVTRV